jgi:hypothetical protein
MKINKYHTFNWRILPWFIPAVLAITLNAIVIPYNKTAPIYAWIIFGLCDLGFIGLGIVATLIRYFYAKTILGYTSQGVSIIVRGGLKNTLGNELIQKVDDLINEVVFFWDFVYDKDIILNYLNGAQIILTGDANDINLTIDKKNAFLGLAQDNTAIILIPKILLNMDLRIIRHELGHICLNAVEIKADEHHSVFERYFFEQ